MPDLFERRRRYILLRAAGFQKVGLDRCHRSQNIYPLLYRGEYMPQRNTNMLSTAEYGRRTSSWLSR